MERGEAGAFCYGPNRGTSAKIGFRGQVGSGDFKNAWIAGELMFGDVADYSVSLGSAYLGSAQSRFHEPSDPGFIFDLGLDEAGWRCLVEAIHLRRGEVRGHITLEPPDNRETEFWETAWNDETSLPIRSAGFTYNLTTPAPSSTPKPTHWITIGTVAGFWVALLAVSWAVSKLWALLTR